MPKQTFRSLEMWDFWSNKKSFKWNLGNVRLQEFLKGEGYSTLFLEARRLVPNAVCWIAVPCSTWVFMSLGYVPLSFQFQQKPAPPSDIFRSRGSTHRSWLRASGLGAPIVVRLQLHFHVRQYCIYVRETRQPNGETNCLLVARQN